MKYEVFVLQIILKYDLEDAGRVIGPIKTAVKRWCHPGMHARRNIAFVIVTDETIEDLARRLLDPLKGAQDSGGVERFFLTADPGRVISDLGDFDPLAHWLGMARVEAGERNKPQNMRDRQRRKPWVKRTV